MKLVAAIATLIGVIQLVGSHSLFGLVWIIAGIVLFILDRVYGD